MPGGLEALVLAISDQLSAISYQLSAILIQFISEERMDVRPSVVLDIILNASSYSVEGAWLAGVICIMQVRAHQR